MADYVGYRFGDYHVLRLLEQEVNGNPRLPGKYTYLGEHAYSRAPVSVHILEIPNGQETHPCLSNFLIEARALASLENPHILRVFNFGRHDDNNLFLITSYTHHRTLRQRYPEGMILPLSTAVSYVKQASSGLQYAHDAKITHCNIRPETMLLGHNDDILLDFSTTILDKALNGLLDELLEERLISEYEMDKMWYWAPEQFFSKPCEASDQYALGTILYEWLSGTRPFQDSSRDMETIYQHAFTPPPPLHEKTTTVSPALEGVILTALAKEPQYRFANVRSFAIALEEASRPHRSGKVTHRPGQQLGNYRLTHLLGRGGFADVYLAEHIYLKTQAAIKVLHKRLAGDDLEGFLTEGQIVASLEHPHIVRVFDFGMDNDGNPFLSMSYAPHGSLRQRHPKGVKLPLSTIVSYVKQIADALQLAHNAGLVHRDIKPENMLVGRNSEILLSDFGIAAISATVDPQREQNLAGTWTYMAPEQIQKQPSRASDQYALGITVYEWLCGTPPFQGTWQEIAIKHLQAQPPSLREKVLDIPPAVERVVLAALAKDSLERFVNVREFAMALERACQPIPRGTILLTYGNRAGAASALAWSPDGTRIAAGCADGTVQVWNATTGRTLLTYHGHGGNVSTLAWSPDGTYIASAGNVDRDETWKWVDSTVQVWEVATGHLLFTYQGHAGNIPTATFESSMGVWELSTYRGPGNRDISAVAWSPDGTRIASGGNRYDYEAHRWVDPVVQVWDAMTGNTICTYRGHSRTVGAVAWSPDGTRIASGCADGTIQVWNVATKTISTTYRRHSSVEAVAWSPDGSRIASGSTDGIVQVWDTTTDVLTITYRGHYETGIAQTGAWLWSSDGRRIAPPVRSLAWSPNSTYIASSCAGTVQVWNATTGEKVFTHDVHISVDNIFKGGNIVIWSPDGSRIAFGDVDGGVMTFPFSTSKFHSEWIGPGTIKVCQAV